MRSHIHPQSQYSQPSTISNNGLVVIRGAGDIATGVAVRLFNAGFAIVMTETARPTMIRCSVAFGQCLFSGTHTVEAITAVKANDLNDVVNILNNGNIPVIVDETVALTSQLKPACVVDAILAKRNLHFTRDMAPFTIALGPGFTAGQDCDAVIETNRGHHLGRVIYDGCTQHNTGTPGNIAGFTHERVIRSPCPGVMHNFVKLGDIVEQGEVIAQVNNTPIHAPLSGMVRGLLNEGIDVTTGFKIGDIDPRGQQADYTTVSDKARAIGGSVLEAMLHLQHVSNHQRTAEND